MTSQISSHVLFAGYANQCFVKYVSTHNDKMADIVLIYRYFEHLNRDMY